MKKSILLLMATLISAPSFANEINQKSSLEQQVGYSLGYNMASNNSDVFKDLDIDAFLQGFKAAIAGKNPSLSTAEMGTALSQYRQQTESRALVEFQQQAAANLQAGQKFLAQNAKAANVKVTKSGLQYQVLKNAKGKQPKASSTVRVHYEGRLLDNTVFDSSIARQQPAEFKLSQVIAGWTEGVQLMPVGSKYRFFIPAKLAYDDIGSGDAIAPNSTLIFDIELLEILD
ncbi:FKBP-type peptidyl-prolyl cis-trans isomerase [Acinetobacter sp. B51(2017)]|uniref:FKBP-type peptidyl-prolyl cis-trans isomerase n=1 Tax=Acinetobacter sp. B51(2017) TaxID=2060938 RepID=UPI000F074623|nr:FKBP-type peptidyl-prolyl cis-trans isomerase [Acinetobacter sp. B51(2017)]